MYFMHTSNTPQGYRILTNNLTDALKHFFFLNIRKYLSAGVIQRKK